LNYGILTAPRGSGYDILAKQGNIEKHIEAKGIKNNDTFFAVNGLEGIHEIPFDSEYYLYFCDLKTDSILIANNKFVHRAMGWNVNGRENRLINFWLELGHSIKSISGVAVDGRIRFHISPSIRTIISSLQDRSTSISHDLLLTVEALWKKQKNGELSPTQTSRCVWCRVYP
jgi:hypothetical protein